VVLPAGDCVWYPIFFSQDEPPFLDSGYFLFIWDKLEDRTLDCQAAWALLHSNGDNFFFLRVSSANRERRNMSLFGNDAREKMALLAYNSQQMG
jgi:hypothetical protein